MRKQETVAQEAFLPGPCKESGCTKQEGRQRGKHLHAPPGEARDTMLQGVLWWWWWVTKRGHFRAALCSRPTESTNCAFRASVLSLAPAF